ncbi:MAG TPA: hypothetical protein VLY63_18810 [Anaerolineae bacterium]|nr:hypothetical protein [Anaerolineae bacterium]
MMLEFVNESVSVEVQVRRDGKTRPKAFSWRGQYYEIVSWGRESTDTTEDERPVHCYLVQTAGPESWELCRDIQAGQWTLVRHWSSKYRTV